MAMLSDVARVNVHSLPSSRHLPMTTSKDHPTETIIDEKQELLTLKHQLHIYKGATAELITYLHSAFSVVGGISALPLSDATKSVVERMSSETLTSPLSPNSCTDSTRVFSGLQPESFSSDTHRNTIDNMALLVASWETGVGCSNIQSMETNKSTMPCGDMTGGIQDKLAAQIGELQQTINEQRCEIEDLTEMRREYTHEVHELRRQLKDIKSAGDTRRFVKAWDSAGLTRTPSMMYLSSTIPALLHNVGRQVKQSTDKPDSYRGLDAALSPKASRLASYAPATNRLSRIASSASLDSHSHDISSRDSSVDNACRPSGFINGWPIYDTDNGIATSAQSNEDNPATQQDPSAGDELPTPSTSLQPVQNTIPHQESVESELSARLTDASSNAPSAIRTPRLFRTIVAKTPRRIYSKLNEHFKKT